MQIASLFLSTSTLLRSGAIKSMHYSDSISGDFTMLLVSLSFFLPYKQSLAAAQAPQGGSHEACLRQERDIELVKQYNVDAVFMPKSLYAKGMLPKASAWLSQCSPKPSAPDISVTWRLCGRSIRQQQC